MNPFTTVKPKARKGNLIVQKLENELLVYDQKINEAGCLNDTATRILNLCDGKQTVAEIAKRMSKETGTAVNEKLVWYGIDQLNQKNLLSEKVTVPPEILGADVSRRAFLRKAAMMGAIALPVILSVSVPPAYAQASCLGDGSPCITGAQCCSGNCSGVCLGVT